MTVTSLKEQARVLGFDVCGIAPAAALPELTRLKEWLGRGYAGEMVYLHKSADTRADIRHFLPTARSVIVTATNYFVDPPSTPHIARYAWGDDYHIVLAERLEQLTQWMRDHSEEPFDARIFVDKHHVQERAFAKHAGLGWIAKNTMLLNADLGSWTFLAGIAVSLDLEPDAPVADGCGACTICLDACPTGALVDAYELDATRCISYLTIEHKSAIPEEARPGVGDHVYGCDVCQDVCPYNLAPLATLDPAWQPKAGRATATPAELWRRSDFDLHRMVEGSAMTRVTVSRLRRNVAVALGNAGTPEAAGVLDQPGGGVRRAAQSAETPVVHEHMTWAKTVLKAGGNVRKM
ncbi:MAG TPA: tRNA epoxyqueuosine(34) reductase QueG [Vicinamibacterales bacterium]|nr:tRNA epoxyqueuosine(34) reductase QueG [Vicinamibacterales bacterium]